MIINHGVRGSVPNPSQKNMIFGGNTPCVEIKTNQYQLIFDCGTGFSKVDFSNDLQSIIFISHFHHDHIQGLAFNSFNSDLKKKIIVTSAHSNAKKTHDYFLTGGGKLSDHNDAGPVGGGGSAQRDDGTRLDLVLCYVLYCRQSDWDRPPLTFIGACGPTRDARGALESGDRPP